MHHRGARYDSRVAGCAIYTVLFIRVIFSAITRRILRTHFTHACEFNDGRYNAKVSSSWREIWNEDREEFMCGIWQRERI